MRSTFGGDFKCYVPAESEAPIIELEQWKEEMSNLSKFG